MSKLTHLNVFVTERLTSVAAEISEVFERTVVELHEEISRSKEENDRLRRLLDLVFHPENKVQTPDPQHSFHNSDEEVHTEQQYHVQEWSPNMGQEDPYPTQVKEDCSKDEEQLQCPGQIDMIKFISPPTCEQENPSYPSHSNTLQPVEDQEKERCFFPTKTNEDIKREPDIDGYAVSEQTIHIPPLSEVNPDCSVAQSENRQNLELAYGPNNVESAHVSVGERPETLLPHFTLPTHQPSLAASYGCMVCREMFVSRVFLIHHVRKMHMENEDCQCGVCGRNLHSKDSLVGHLQTHIKENISCHVDEKCLSENSDLNIHMMSHTGGKSYQCSQCRKCYTQKVQLKCHMRTHTGGKQFRCQECGKCVARKSTLSNHMLIHRGEKPHKCKLCGKCFTESGTLSRHMRVHTGEKPYQCQECGKGFSERGNLSKHIKTHRLEKPFSCSYCSKCFTYNANCKRHIKTVHKSKTL